MATRTTSLTQSNSTDANFRAWINEIHTSLTTYGWTQTADSGQVNYSTATRPTTTNVYPWYAVYAMGDSLQSTSAVYLRLDYGTGTNTDVPAIKYQVGIGGTDGAGTLTGNYQAQVTLAPDATGSAANVRTSGTSSSFQMAFWNVNSSGRGWCVVIERERDSSGTELDTGVSVVSFVYNPGAGFFKHSQFIPRLPVNTKIAWPEDTIWYALISAQSTQNAGGNIGMSPVRVTAGYMKPPMLSLMIFARTDFTMETTFTVTIYGSSHTYLALRPYSGGALSLNTINADTGFAIRWE